MVELISLSSLGVVLLICYAAFRNHLKNRDKIQFHERLKDR